jgi:hypothetical protein
VPEPVEGDLNHDCFVDWYDLEWFFGQWLSEDCLYTGWCYEADLNYGLAENWQPPCVGDLNRDGEVDMNDLVILAHFWLLDEPQADIAPAGGDDIVNFLDFAVFSVNWD